MPPPPINPSVYIVDSHKTTGTSIMLVYPSISSYRLGKSSVIAMSYDAGPYDKTGGCQNQVVIIFLMSPYLSNRILVGLAAHIFGYTIIYAWFIIYPWFIHDSADTWYKVFENGMFLSENSIQFNSFVLSPCKAWLQYIEIWYNKYVNIPHKQNGSQKSNAYLAGLNEKDSNIFHETFWASLVNNYVNYPTTDINAVIWGSPGPCHLGGGFTS